MIAVFFQRVFFSVIMRLAVLFSVNDSFCYFFTVLHPSDSRTFGSGFLRNCWLNMQSAFVLWWSTSSFDLNWLLILNFCRFSFSLLFFSLVLFSLWGIFWRLINYWTSIFEKVLWEDLVEFKNNISEISNSYLTLIYRLICKSFSCFYENFSNPFNQFYIVLDIFVCFFTVILEIIHYHYCFKPKPVCSRFNYSLVAIFKKEQMLICTVIGLFLMS